MDKASVQMTVVLMAALAVTGKSWAAMGAVDVEALTLIATIDQNEIQAAEYASGMDISAQVRNYANMLKREHTRSLNRTRDLAQEKEAQMNETPMIRQVKEDGSQDMAALRPLEGEQFSQAYVTAMVEGHSKALSMLDRIKAGLQDADVQKHVDDTRDRISDHLKKGQDLQTELNAEVVFNP